MRVFDENGKNYFYTFKNGVLTVNKNDISENVSFLEFEFEEYLANINDEGYYVVTSANSSGAHLTYFTEKQNADMVIIQKMMPFFGVKKADLCHLVVCTGMQHDFYLHLGVNNGNYFINPRIELDGEIPYENIEFKIFEIEGGYVEMAKKYRSLRQDLVPLKERAKNNPYLDYAIDAPEIRIRMGWKPAPPAILTQTIENEPEMHVACTFKDVEKFITKLKASGVDKAQICLVGWNKSGHDGRYPDLFPVEEKLGGKDRLRDLIEYAQNNGYQIVCHTNSTDAYEIAFSYSEKDIIKKKDGSLQENGCGWSGGRMFHLCPEVAYKQAQENLPKVRELGFKGIHYIDVMSTISLRKCYDAVHPLNKKQSGEYFEKIGKLAKEIFGGFSSEGGFDFSASYLDYALYIAFNKNREQFFDVAIPLWQIIYHGYILSNASTDTVNYPIKGEKSYKEYIESGSRPSFYIYSKFMTNTPAADWLGREDLIIDTEEGINGAVETIKKAYEEYKNIRHLQREFIVDHKIEGDKRIITYSDNTVVSV